MLISKTLKDCIYNEVYKTLDKEIFESVKKLTINAIVSQISHVLEYLNVVVIIQLYNLLK